MVPVRVFSYLSRYRPQKLTTSSLVDSSLPQTGVAQRCFVWRAVLCAVGGWQHLSSLPLDANSTPSLSCDNPKYLQTLPKGLGGGRVRGIAPSWEIQFDRQNVGQNVNRVLGGKKKAASGVFGCPWLGPDSHKFRWMGFVRNDLGLS